MANRRRRGAAWLWGASGLAVVVLSSACHVKVTRLAAAGRYDDAIEHAESRKWEPRGASARAYARALVERRRYDEARDVLFRDFRRGQHFESLDALASLELRLGARGMAAVHFARLMELDRPRLEGRDEVCQLFRERARAHLAQDEPIAADQDLRRVYELCEGPSEASIASADRQLAEAIAPRAEARARALRKLPGEPEGPPVTRAQRDETFAAQRKAARELGWEHYGRWAAQQGLGLETEETLDLLLDEFDDPGRGELYPAWYLDTWIAAGTVAAVLDAAQARKLDTAQQAYLRLRLAPLAARRGEGTVSEGLEQAQLEVSTRVEGVDEARQAARGWKGLVLSGQVEAAELVLSTWLKGSRQPTPDPLGAEGAQDDSSAGVRAPTVPSVQWWRRGSIEPAQLGAWMALGRLREARGDGRRAMELWLALPGRAGESAAAQVREALTREAHRQLRRGQPWRALVLSEELATLERDALRGAAETQLALLEVLCRREGSACSLLAMRAEAERLRSESWVRERERGMTAQRPAKAREDACALGAELLARDPDGTLGRFSTLQASAPSVEERRALAVELHRQIEADVTFGCQARMRVELLHALVAQLELATLSEYLSQATVQRSSAVLETKATLALAEGNTPRAWEMTRAAAADSADPRAVMQRAARLGRAWKNRDFELSARLRLAALDPAARHGANARALLRIRFEDAFASALLRREWEPATRAWREDFERHLGSIPDTLRWGEGRRLAALLHEARPESPEAAVAWQQLMVGLFGEAAVLMVSQPLPPIEGAFLMGEPGGDALGQRVGAISYGGDAERTAALVALFDSLDTPATEALRAELVQLLVQGGTALDEEGRPRDLLARDDLAWRLAFALPIDLDPDR